MADVVLELADSFQKRLAFDIPDRAADLNDGDVGVFGCEVAVKTVFDFICNVRDYLNCAASEIPPAFFL